MFVGHAGIALAAKSKEPSIPLGWWAAGPTLPGAAFLAPLAWALVLSAGAGEAVAQAPSAAPGAAAGVAEPAARLAPGARIPCTVERITDGDTFRCVGLGPVRLLLIDTPEMDQAPFGTQARDALAALLPVGATVELEIDVEPTDRYDRTLAYVLLPGVPDSAAGADAPPAGHRIANEEMLRLGFAVASVYPPNVKYVDRFRAVVEEARAARRGLWSVEAFACLPVDHRAGRC